MRPQAVINALRQRSSSSLSTQSATSYHDDTKPAPASALAPVQNCADLTAAEALLSLTPRSVVPLQQQQLQNPTSTVPVVENVQEVVSQHPRRVPGLVSCGESVSDASLDSFHSEWMAPSITSTSPTTIISPTPNCAYFTTESVCISLALNTDEDYLSPLHCFERRYCVEAFTATEDDIAQPRHFKTHGARVVVGQVGIRCLHCKHRPLSARGERAVCFPSSLKNIYHSIETWQRRHSLVCPDIPKWVKKSMLDLTQNSKSGAGGRRKYWEESARRLGLVDTSNGIRLISLMPPVQEPAPRSVPACVATLTADGITEAPGALAVDTQSHFCVVRSDDQSLVTNYLFLLLEQMVTCRFTEEDRAGGRSKVKDCPVGFPGMQCKHCGGKAGFGRYFPTSVAALSSANSDRNIFNHVSKCRRCPQPVKDQLIALRDEQAQAKNRRGSRKLFFERVWDRIHDGNIQHL